MKGFDRPLLRPMGVTNGLFYTMGREKMNSEVNKSKKNDLTIGK